MLICAATVGIQQKKIKIIKISYICALMKWGRKKNVEKSHAKIINISRQMKFNSDIGIF